MIWRLRESTLDLGRRARVMGVLNVTPDSFSDGGRFHACDAALNRARRMVEEGADIIDVGGESTRPGSEPAPEELEMERVLPVIRGLRAEWDGLISIDTMKAAVAAAALEAGADIVNDISGLRHDPAMAGVCRESGCGVVLTHMLGTPRDMQTAPEYDNVADTVAEFFAERHETLSAAGLDPLTLCFDPGIGFGKTVDHNLTLLAELHSFAATGWPILLGVSRKSFIGRVLGIGVPEERDTATAVLTAAARRQGVMLHRVHAVRPAVQALRLTEAVLAAAGV